MTIMTVPETPINEDNCTIFRQNQVRRALQIFAVQAKPETTRVQRFSDHNFRFSILTSDAGHHSGPSSTVYHINHFAKYLLEFKALPGILHPYLILANFR